MAAEVASECEVLGQRVRVVARTWPTQGYLVTASKELVGALGGL